MSRGIRPAAWFDSPMFAVKLQQAVGNQPHSTSDEAEDIRLTILGKAAVNGLILFEHLNNNSCSAGSSGSAYCSACAAFGES